MIAEQKKILRKSMLAKRDAFNKKEKRVYDQWICDELWNVIMVQNAKVVHCYLPLGSEINLYPLIEKMLEERITVVAPKTLPKPRLQNLVLNSLKEIEKGVFGTSHPANSQEFKDEYDLIIVPGLAFNNQNYRLGYGGGYYDTFLAQQPAVFKQGIFYPFQKVDELPLEPHDVQLSSILVNSI